MGYLQEARENHVKKKVEEGEPPHPLPVQASEFVDLGGLEVCKIA
jgi:hypothetical protein